MPETIMLASPAKVNYYLQVTGRRPDGFHDLVSVMCRVSLFDEIEVRIGGRGVRVECDHPGVPSGRDNSVDRAVRLVLQRAPEPVGIDVRIHKRIPVQSGLGGASSNAASVIACLNEALDLGLTRRELLDLGMQVGSDVPFFLFGSPAVARGRGEILERVEGIPDAWLVIVKPQAGISTKEAYEKLDLLLTKNENGLIIIKFTGTLRSLVELMSNDFEPVAETLLGEITDIKARLVELGALRAMLSGSGSAVFGVFADEEGARRAHRQLCNHPKWDAYVARNLFE